MYVNDYHLNNQMERDKYIMIQLSMIPQKFVEKCNLAAKAHNGYIHARVTKRMYELPPVERIAHDVLLKQLDLYVYHPSSKNLGLWKHNSRPINFTLVVDYFGVKYSGEEHALYLKIALETIYKVTTDWEGTLCIGIELKWDY